MKKNTNRLFSALLALAMLISLLPAIALTAGAEDSAYVLAQDIEVGKTYVLVADGQFALNNQSVDWGSYSGSTTNTLGSTPVEVEDGVITSPVTEDMLWTIQPAEAEGLFTDPIYDLPMYHIYDQEGRLLNRRSGSTATAPLEVGGSFSKLQYATISFHPRPDGSYTVFFNTNATNDYPFSFHGTADGFNAPGVAQSSWEPDTYQSSIQLYELGGSVTEVIDFKDPADSEKYEIVGQTQSDVEEGVGLALICTRKSIEPAKRPNSAEYIGAEDVVEVPIDGDWTATLNFDYDPNNGGGAYAFFSFFASQGDDYQNMLGIRGGDGAMQNFERHDGEVTHEDEEDVNSAPGFTDAAEYWFRIEKTDDTYICFRSEDGEEFTQIFSYEASGIEASKLIIDAYSASSQGNGRKFTLKTLTIEKASNICSHEYVEEVVPPTCTERGYTEHTCTKCGRTYKSDFVEELGHDFGEYTKTKDFTETERGELTAYCSRCDATKTRPIAAGNEKPHKNELLFISDVHSAKRAEEGFHNLRALFGLLKSEDNFIPEVISGGGDYIESSTNDNADWPHAYDVLHQIIYEGDPDGFQALGSGNHEWEWSKQSEEMIEKLLGQPRVCNSYNSDDFAIFHIGAHMNGTGQEEFKTEDIEKLHTFLDTQVGNGKVIFVQTHWPLHYAYNWAWRTTKNAGTMIDLLNEYSEKMDICFVWGHNHHQDAHRHQFYGRNDVLQISATEYKRIKFNYLNAGCLNENAAEQDAGPSGSDYGPGYCLEARLQGDRLILDYAHITGAYPDPTQAKLDHNADLLYVEEIQEARPSHHEIQFIRTGECDHDYTSTHVDPTCTEWGKDIYTCSKCGVTYDDVVDGRDDPLGHDWDEGEITVAPTAQAAGLMTYHCTRCDETKTKKLRRIGADIPDDIDFTTADSFADKQYEILGPTGYVQSEDGLVIKTTRNAVEDCNGQNSGSQASTPEDMIRVPVHGDWSATLNFGFDTAGASNGYYQFFGFYAAEGEDYQNMAGVRGGDKALQNFIRKDGTITADDEEISSAPGLDTVKDYWIRIDKTGDTYTCYRSEDGEEFTEMFAYEDTGINADAILIDAYTGMTTGYEFTLKSLVFDETGNGFLFDDVADEGKFYFDPVYWAFFAQPQITNGLDETHFGPDNSCTRGQVVTFLWRAAGQPEPKSTKTDFKDLKKGAFYEKAVAWAVENGITSGTSKTTFSPDGKCTRGQIVTFLWRFKGKPAPQNAATPFKDLKKGGFYLDAVAWAVENDVTNGLSADKFGPDNTCTRGQVVTFLYRAVK